VLFQRAYAHTDLKAYFLDAAERCAQRSLEDNWLVNEFERVVVMIRPSALEDPRKQFTNDEFERDVEEVRKMVTFRPAFVLQDVAQRRSSPDALVLHLTKK
jgi:hypothetical protein